MKREEMRKEHYNNYDAFYKKCPICKRRYIGIGAISRKDNETEICSQCGTEEAIFDFIKYKRNTED